MCRRSTPRRPPHQTAPQQYVQFLFACASDPRFTADTILAEIAKNHQLSTLDRLIYRFVIIPRTRRGMLDLKNADCVDAQRGRPGAAAASIRSTR